MLDRPLNIGRIEQEIVMKDSNRDGIKETKDFQIAAFFYSERTIFCKGDTRKLEGMAAPSSVRETN